MRKLSTRRRHPLAGLVVLLTGLVVAGGLYAAFAPEPATAEAVTSRDVEAGRQLFIIGCASCHGVNAEGIGTVKGNVVRPVAGRSRRRCRRLPGRHRTHAHGADRTAGTARRTWSTTDEEIRQLAAFVASLAPGPAIPGDEYTDIDEASIADIREGGEIFRTNCTACHNSVGAGGAMPGGKYAPDIRDVTPMHLAEAMITGPQQMPVFSDAVITPEDKRNVIAYVKKLNSEPGYGGIGGGSLGPVVDGMFTWIIGIGGLAGFAIWIGAHGARVKKR